MKTKIAGLRKYPWSYYKCWCVFDALLVRDCCIFSATLVLAWCVFDAYTALFPA